MSTKTTHKLSLALAVSMALAAGASAQITGPSSSATPYVLPLAGLGTPNYPYFQTTSILSVGNTTAYVGGGNSPTSVGSGANNTAANRYAMSGIPDGLGAFDNDDGTFTLLMNHELGATAGIARAHGAKGAFVSRWIIDKRTLKVLHGKDLMESVGLWNGADYVFSTPVAFARFCSADLPERSAFWNKRTRRGTRERLFMNGEENGAEGRAFAHAMDGTTYELPWLGKMSFENTVANPATADDTIVACTDDDAAGQIYVYAGHKQLSGDTPVEEAGLTNGVVFGVKVTGFPFEDPVTAIPSGTRFTVKGFGDVSATTGAALQTASRAAGVTEFNRPEDGCWDPTRTNDFYFVTTASFTGNSRLWRLRFDDASIPELGGRIDLLLGGTEGPKMMDNITIDEQGRIVIQEDPGGQNHIAKLWLYDIDDDEIVEIAQHDPVRFGPGGAGFLTNDEESSGVIDVSDILGDGKFLLDAQAHYGLETELVQGGQLLLLELDKPHKHKAKKDKHEDRRDRCDD